MTTDHNTTELQLGGRPIGAAHPPFIIAELSGNHNQSLERALQLVDAAAAAGAHAIKLQTYTPDTMTLDIDSGDFYIDDPNSLWKETSLYKLYGQAYTPWQWHQPIFAKARSLGLIAFSSPFDRSAVDFLEDLQVPFYKIASFENTDLPLIRYVASKGKPVIISTGMASVAELDQAVSAAREAGCHQLILLKCTSTYPASAEHTNIATIAHMRQLFGCEVGLSDHTQGVGVAVASVALGARVIEKHFTLDRADGGVDSAFSLEPDELAHLVRDTHIAYQALGKVHYGPTAAEQASLQFRRSIYVVKDLKPGDVLDEDCIKIIRPGFGLAPQYRDIVLGRTLRCAVARGTALHWDMI